MLACSLLQHVVGQPELFQCARGGAHHRRLRQAAGAEPGGGAGIEMQRVGKDENNDEAGTRP